MVQERVTKIQVQSVFIEREGIKNADLETGYAAANAVVHALMEKDLRLPAALDLLGLDLFGRGKLLYDYLVAVHHKGKKVIEPERIKQLEVVAGVCWLLKPYFVERDFGSGIVHGRIRGSEKDTKGRKWRAEGWNQED
ncbi:hypothetical protein KKH13_01890 [Patescibacteria group bacterium]|nr:hypothetical protein [Patescibacteria group bacterium]